MSKKAILTLDDLYNYYSSTSKRSRHFSSKEDDKNIVVQVTGNIVFENDENATEGLTKVVLQANHTGTNLNGSSISDEVAEVALPSFSNRPILAYIHMVDGNWEFYDHRRHMEDDDLVYDERPVGIVPESAEAHLEYDAEKEKTYVVVNGYLFDEYSHASEILQREGECSCSVELCIRELSYNAKDKVLNIEDYYYNGVTILGKDPEGNNVLPGMQGANIKLSDFTASTNRSDDMIEMLNEINNKLDQLSIDNFSRKEEKLMDFETEAQVMEAPVDDTSVEETNIELNEITEETAEVEASTEAVVIAEDQSEERTDTPSEDEKFSKTFEISHEDIRYALYTLLADYENQDNEWYFISAVYDDSFIYESMFNKDHKYKQNYAKNENNISFDGERVHMNIEYLTDSELISLNEMRSNYSALSEKLAKYESEADKLAILDSDDYASIAELEEFKLLKTQEGHFDLSVEQVKEKADAILLNYAKSGKVVFSQLEEKSSVTVKPIPAQASVIRSRYGGLGKKETE